MIAEHLERGVIADAFGEVHQTHVIADDEGQCQRGDAQNRECCGGRVHDAGHFDMLVGRIEQA